MKKKKLQKSRKFRPEALSGIKSTVIALILLFLCSTIPACKNAQKLEKETTDVPAGSSVSAKQSKSNIASIAPTDLQCEYLINPLGIDVKAPRLSWKLKATEQNARGQKKRG